MDRDQLVERTGEEVAHRARQLRAWWFQVAVLAAAVGFGVLALLARTVWYFPIDLELTRGIQGMRTPWVDGLLGAVTWIGFPPQSNLIFGAVILALFLLGLRLEALMTFVAAAGSAGLWYLITPLVDRPRPSPELVDVAMQIPAGSFPSGHALNLTAIFGFLLYLTILLVRRTLARRALQVLLALPIPTIGLARIEDGAHWPSDVLGGYMLGGLWLALTIHLYRWSKQRLSERHGGVLGPVAAVLTARNR
jgi:membrane-associated phospholipid phosphatase